MCHIVLYGCSGLPITIVRVPGETGARCRGRRLELTEENVEIVDDVEGADEVEESAQTVF